MDPITPEKEGIKEVYYLHGMGGRFDILALRPAEKLSGSQVADLKPDLEKKTLNEPLLYRIVFGNNVHYKSVKRGESP